MPNKNYDRGASKERELMKLFKDAEMNKDAGAIETIRAAGSHGVFDVVILEPTGVRFIQVKTCDRDGYWKSDYKEAKETIQQLYKPAGNITYEVWVYKNYKGWVKREIIK